MSLRDSGVEEIFHAGITFKIFCNVFARLFAADVQILRKPVVADSVDNAEVYSFGFAAQVGRNFFKRHAKNFRRRPRVNILPFVEGVD